MDKKEGSHLGKPFISCLLVASVLNFGIYCLVNYEAAVIFAFCWLTAMIVTATAGIENTLNQKH